VRAPCNATFSAHGAQGDERFIINAEERGAWGRDGCVTVRQLLDDEAIAILRGAIEGDPVLRASLYDRHDASGKATCMALSRHLHHPIRRGQRAVQI